MEGTRENKKQSRLILLQKHWLTEGEAPELGTAALQVTITVFPSQLHHGGKINRALAESTVSFKKDPF